VSGPARRLLLGIGNRLRGDDAAGLEVVARVARLAPGGIDVRTLKGDAVSLLETWRGFDDVIVVDTVAAEQDGPPVRRLTADEMMALAHAGGHASGHGLGLAEAVRLGHVLDGLPRRLVVFAVRGEQFAHGEGLSRATASAIEPATVAVLAELAGWQECSMTAVPAHA
jgi:hydrogenase maturation protease